METLQFYFIELVLPQSWGGDDLLKVMAKWSALSHDGPLHACIVSRELRDCVLVGWASFGFMKMN